MKSLAQANCSSDYTQDIPDIPLISYKFALQLIPESGFDSTARLQMATKDEQSHANSDKCSFYDKIQPICEQLHKACTIDYSFMEQLINDEESSDPMGDETYVYSHAIMESLEQLFDRYENQFEYSIYENVKKYSLDIALEDQQISTLTPLQMYLAPQDVRVYCPNICARPSHILYSAPLQDKTLQISFTPQYKQIPNPNVQQKCYIHNLLNVKSSDLNPDYIFRQPSAHEQWVHIVCAGIGLTQLSIEKCFKQLIEYRVQDFVAKINEIKYENTADVEDHLQANYNVDQKNVKILTSQIIDKLVDKCITQMREVFKHKLEPPIRTYEFTSDFDVSIRGIIESKQVTHSFYQFDEDVKIAFIKPIVAQKLLHYHKIGSFSKFINKCLHKKQPASENSQDVHQNLYAMLCKMNEKFFQYVKKQHQILLKSMLTSIYSLDYIKVDLDEENQINIDSDVDKLMIRPFCSCFTCNFWSTYDKFDISERIFPFIKLRKSTEQQIISHAARNNKKDLRNYYNLTFNPKIFVETVLGVDYNAELSVIIPYFPNVNKQLNKVFWINLIPADQNIEKVTSLKQQNKSKKFIEIYPYAELLEYVQVFSLLVPTFLVFPAPYGQVSSQYLPIVLSERYRKDLPYDARLETLLCIINDPTKLIEQKKSQVQQIQLHGRYNHRTVAQVQNGIVSRNICMDSGIAYQDPILKQPIQYSDYEVASILFTQSELGRFQNLKKDKTIVYSNLRDVREVNALQYNIKHLNSLLIAKKYNGKIPEQSSTSQQRQVISQKITNDKLKVEISDLAFMNTMFNIIYKQDADKLDDQIQDLDNYSVCDTQKSFSPQTGQ